ncbi:MAG TPA: phosphonoacetaldehyde dehydrogenase [Burkholderiaceae bacterium]|nr:phosphonoacetaldehyde dehydrogenase [Burkholderiaceae bacterium]
MGPTNTNGVSQDSVIDEVRVEAMRIAGERVHRDETIDVCYPYTGEVIATVPKATLDDVRRAFRIAKQYQSKLTRADRYNILMRARDLIAARRDEIARLITLESGLCLMDTLHEVGRASDVLLFSANQALIDDGQVFSCDLTPHGKQRKVYTMRQPLLGAISAITPFNHPLNQVIHKVAPSIATNNRMVLKPTEKTPLAAILLADILYEAGLPPEMLSVITGDPKDIADEMLTNPDVDLVTFTGGVAIGKYIAAKAVYKRQVLELGGNAPFIIMEDADLAKAAAMTAAGSYKNSGQRCTAVKRIFVQESVAKEFGELLMKETKALKFGDPLDPTTEIGTVIDEEAAMRFESLVINAVEHGAELLYGNKRVGAQYCPTLVDKVRPEMDLIKYETFGPVSPLTRFKTIDEVIGLVNASPYGLSAGVYTNRMDYITRFISELQVGTVNICEVPGYRLELTPFGGIKDSGLGYKEGVIETMKGYTNVKTYSLPW